MPLHFHPTDIWRCASVWRIQAKDSMAPSCLVQSSIAANQGSTRSRKLFMVSSVAILLSTPTHRAAMWRTAVYGCCRQVNRWGRCSRSWSTKTNRRETFNSYISTAVLIHWFSGTDTHWHNSVDRMRCDVITALEFQPGDFTKSGVIV